MTAAQKVATVLAAFLFALGGVMLYRHVGTAFTRDDALIHALPIVAGLILLPNSPFVALIEHALPYLPFTKGAAQGKPSASDGPSDGEGGAHG
jgi:hypothetical protein